jgi:hypothetical protein
MNLTIYKVWWHGLDISGSGWRPMGGSCEHDNEPSGSTKCCEVLSGCTTGGRSRRAQLHGVIDVALAEAQETTAVC